MAKWENLYQEMLSIANLHRKISCSNPSSFELGVNQGFTAEESSILSVIDIIERYINLVSAPTNNARIRNILTYEVVTEDISDQLLDAEDIGTRAHEKLQKEVLQRDSSTL